MNGFKIIADSYREALAKGEVTKEEAGKKCKAFDFLGTCDQEDLFNLFDSSAFNEIAKSYLRLTVKELVSEGKLTEAQGREVRNRFSLLFDEKQAEEVCKISG